MNEGVAQLSRVCTRQRTGSYVGGDRRPCYFFFPTFRRRVGWRGLTNKGGLEKHVAAQARACHSTGAPSLCRRSEKKGGGGGVVPFGLSVGGRGRRLPDESFCCHVSQIWEWEGGVWSRVIASLCQFLFFPPSSGFDPRSARGMTGASLPPSPTFPPVQRTLVGVTFAVDRFAIPRPRLP